MFCVRLPSMICQWKRSYKSRDDVKDCGWSSLLCVYCSSDGAEPFTNTLKHSSWCTNSPHIIYSAQESRALRVIVLSWNGCARAVQPLRNERSENDFTWCSFITTADANTTAITMKRRTQPVERADNLILTENLSSLTVCLRSCF